MPVFERRSTMPVPVDDLAAWHTRAGAFDRLRAPWQHVRVLVRGGGAAPGARTVLSVGMGPLHTRWVSQVTEYEPGRRFVDVQASGPFSRWRHTHLFEGLDDGTSRLEDRVEYDLPLGAAGDRLGGVPVRRALERLFRFRHRRTADDLQRHAAYRDKPRLTVAITGASGLIGSELAAFLTSGGHRVIKLVRRPPVAADEVFWDPERSALVADRLAGVDAVVHLAGHSINSGRWTPTVKEEILNSRLAGTGLIARTVAQLDPKPVLISQSAIGYYGNRAAEGLDEAATRGTDYLAGVAAAWEAATQPAQNAGARVVTLRTGIVLSGQGGALARMLPVYRLGIGGIIAGGHQWMSWVAMEDWLGIVLDLLYDAGAEGPVNAVSPHPVTNHEFIRTLAKVLRRPSLIPVTAAQVRLMFGEMGEHLLLDSQRVLPTRLQAKGFEFRYPALEEALRAELGLLRD